MQHFMSDSLGQQKLICSSVRGVVQRSSTRESTPAKFCKRCTHQHVFGCEVGVLPAVPLEDVKVSPLMPRTYTLHAFAPAPCACICVTCVQGSPQAPPFPRPPATHFMSVCHQIHFPICRLACKRLVLKSLRLLLLLLLQETRWLDDQASQALTSALRKGWETWWVDGDGNCF